MGNRGVVDAFCGRLKWVSLSTLSSEVKVLSALAGGVFHLQQLLEEMEQPIREPTICCCDNRGCVQVVEDPGRHRSNTTHVDASAFKVREYVQRRRVQVRWIPTSECLGDIFTKHTIEAEQFFKLWHTLCGYRSWSVLEEITGKAAAVAIEVDGRFVSVQDTRACHMMASACHLALNTYMSTQAAGLGVGATTL